MSILLPVSYLQFVSCVMIVIMYMKVVSVAMWAPYRNPQKMSMFDSPYFAQ